MRRPQAFTQGKVRKCRLKRGIFRTAGVYAESDRAVCGVQVADAHLTEINAVIRTFQAKIIVSAAQAVPYALDRSVDFRGRPIGISAVGHDAAQVLKDIVCIFDGRFQPVFAVEIDDDAALVKAVLAFKPCPHGKRKKFFVAFKLKNRRIVIAEVIICSLPKVGERLCENGDAVVCERAARRFPFPCESSEIRFHDGFPPIGSGFCPLPRKLFAEQGAHTLYISIIPRPPVAVKTFSCVGIDQNVLFPFA